MSKTKNWRKPAGKNSRFTCATAIGYGENIIEGKFGFKDVASGKKTAPLSTELTAGVRIPLVSVEKTNRDMDRG